MLTSLTTFLGVFPLIIEQSVQAQFLIPMAVSLGFGIVFATFVLMGMVPALTKLQYDATVWYQTRLRGIPRDEVELVHASQHSVSDNGKAEDERAAATA
jgi:hypothetical protein